MGKFFWGGGGCVNLGDSDRVGGPKLSCQLFKTTVLALTCSALSANVQIRLGAFWSLLMASVFSTSSTSSLLEAGMSKCLLFLCGEPNQIRGGHLKQNGSPKFMGSTCGAAVGGTGMDRFSDLLTFGDVVCISSAF